MSNKSLAERLKFWRAERPDEWTMDEFIRDAEKLEQERNELAAQVERLREQITPAVRLMRATGECSGWHEKAEHIEKILSEPSPAALAALKAKWLADNADFLRLALELCDAVESQTGLPPVKRAMRFGRLINSIRDRAQEAGDE